MELTDAQERVLRDWGHYGDPLLWQYEYQLPYRARIGPLIGKGLAETKGKHFDGTWRIRLTTAGVAAKKELEKT